MIFGAGMSLARARPRSASSGHVSPWPSLRLTHSDSGRGRLEKESRGLFGARVEQWLYYAVRT